MMSNAQEDALLDRLGQLPSASPDAVRARRVRKRCAVALARRSAAREHARARRRRIGVVIAGGLTAIYAAAFGFDLARLYGVF